MEGWQQQEVSYKGKERLMFTERIWQKEMEEMERKIIEKYLNEKEKPNINKRKGIYVR